MDAEQAKKIHDTLSLAYRGMWTMEQTTDLCGGFNYLPPGDLLEAINRHRHDATPGTQGAPIGQYPPKIANIEAKLSDIQMERIRARNEQRQQEVRKETDDTYRQAVLGQGVSRDDKARTWRASIEAQVRKAKEIREKMAIRYRLDYLKREHMQFLMKTLGEADMLNQSVEEIVGEVAAGAARDLGLRLREDAEAVAA